MNQLKLLWNRWKKTADKIALLQAKIILTVVYIALSPLGAVFVLILDPLRINTETKSKWNPTRDEKPTPISLSQQY